jgi:NAD(P) transhydrogenase subunit alpha
MTTLFIPKETAVGERRVAATPDSVRKFIALGARVQVESGAGSASAIADADYEQAGATLASSASEADIILCVRPPAENVLALAKPGVLLIGMLEPYGNAALLALCNRQHISAMAMELLPRISRAQAMDVLSSQSNLAGYRAVIDAVASFGKAVPMMMTAAGTVSAAKVLVLGAGVAGLQAIATARRLGAIVSAFDVRPAVKEQVESLGAKFIEVPAEGSETAGGYAREMGEEYRQKQTALIHETIRKQDVVITTALIPGKPAPTLITEAMVKDMKPGSVVVDLAAERGGNCALTVAGEVVERHGVTLIGHTNMPSRVAVDASQLYARNLYHFVSTLVLGKEGLAVKWDDELIKGTLLTKGGQTVHSSFTS